MIRLNSESGHYGKKLFGFSKNRLHQPAQFQKVFANGHKFFHAGIILVATSSTIEKDDFCSTAKLGFALPKKIIKLAHERKRLKRMAIEYFRCRQNNFNGGEFVLTLSRSFKFTKAIDSQKEMEKIFDRLWQKYANHFHLTGLQNFFVESVLTAPIA